MKLDLWEMESLAQALNIFFRDTFLSSKKVLD